MWRELPSCSKLSSARPSPSRANSIFSADTPMNHGAHRSRKTQEDRDRQFGTTNYLKERPAAITEDARSILLAAVNRVIQIATMTIFPTSTSSGSRQWVKVPQLSLLQHVGPHWDRRRCGVSIPLPVPLPLNHYMVAATTNLEPVQMEYCSVLSSMARARPLAQQH